jgi:hypothetical protein
VYVPCNQVLHACVTPDTAVRPGPGWCMLTP